MRMQLRLHVNVPRTTSGVPAFLPSVHTKWGEQLAGCKGRVIIGRRGGGGGGGGGGNGLAVVVAASGNAATSRWDTWWPDGTSAAPSASDVLWPAAGAFLAMAVFGKMDQILAPRGILVTIAPFGAVSAVLFATPTAPSARKYNIFMAQIGCAAIGVLAFSLFGPGWLARSAALSASIAFMIYTRSTHPPAASLPLLFIDGAKLHHLNFWYALFPGAAGCVLLCIIQEMISFLKKNAKF